MDLETLEKAKKIAKEIEWCKTYIKKAEWTQLEQVVPRTTYLTIDLEDKCSIEIPKTLFRAIGSLIIQEHKKRLVELEKEFESL